MINGRNAVLTLVETPVPAISICSSAPVMLVNTEASLDDVAIFNVVLSEDEIQGIMDDGLDAAFAVSPTDKLTTTWATLKK